MTALTCLSSMFLLLLSPLTALSASLPLNPLPLTPLPLTPLPLTPLPLTPLPLTPLPLSPLPLSTVCGQRYNPLGISATYVIIPCGTLVAVAHQDLLPTVPATNYHCA